MQYERIVSLTPSITEILFALGVGNRVVGVTDACDYPPEANEKSHVCSWFAPDMDRILALDPKLVLGLSTVHSKLAPFLLEKGITFQHFNPVTVEDALNDMESIGSLIGVSRQAHSLVKNLRQRMVKLAKELQHIQPASRLTVSRILDVDGENLIVAGPRSFQYDVIAKAGGLNVSTPIDEAYPVVSFQIFKKWDPDLIFLCGTDRSYIARLQADPQWQQLSAVQHERIHLFDCALTCRTGPRIIDMAELLFQTLYA